MLQAGGYRLPGRPALLAQRLRAVAVQLTVERIHAFIETMVPALGEVGMVLLTTHLVAAGVRALRPADRAQGRR